MATMDGSDAHADARSFMANQASLAATLSPVPDMQTLELMHHFSTRTSLTVSSTERVRQVWQLEVPKVALSYGWLMHGLLSVAALDLARLGAGDRDRYLKASVHYQNLALRSFTPLLSQMSSANCPTAMFAFSSIMVMSAMAYQQVPVGHSCQDYLSETIKVFRLTRGAAGIFASEYEYIKQGVFASVFQLNSPDNPELELPADVQNAMIALRALTSGSTNSQTVKDILVNATSEVERCWKFSAANPTDHSTNFIFRTQVTDEYMELLKEKEPVSLVILVHYAAALHHMRHYWWIGNWARRLIEAISKELGDCWMAHLEWPVHVVFSVES